LQNLFIQYGKDGTGKRRFYVHNEAEAVEHSSAPGTFTPWQDLPANSDIMLYEGLHGGYVGDGINVPKHADLRIGVVPVINLEWTQKIHRDKSERGYSTEAVMDTILRRMPDYVRHICPQFTQTDVNFQRVPLVDTSNPIHRPVDTNR
jgi:phosphoribulokinase